MPSSFFHLFFLKCGSKTWRPQCGIHRSNKYKDDTTSVPAIHGLCVSTQVPLAPVSAQGPCLTAFLPQRFFFFPQTLLPIVFLPPPSIVLRCTSLCFTTLKRASLSPATCALHYFIYPQLLWHWQTLLEMVLFLRVFLKNRPENFLCSTVPAAFRCEANAQKCDHSMESSYLLLHFHHIFPNSSSLLHAYKVGFE